LRQIDGERQPNRSRTDHGHAVHGDVGGANILIGVSAIAEPGFRLDLGSTIGLCHLFLNSGQKGPVLLN
jgi:hypothetical protein